MDESKKAGGSDPRNPIAQAGFDDYPPSDLPQIPVETREQDILLELDFQVIRDGFRRQVASDRSDDEVGLHAVAEVGLARTLPHQPWAESPGMQ